MEKETQKIQKLYLTSDLHLGHKAMIERKFRPQFKTLDDMDSEIIGNLWRIMPHDKIYILGDVALGSDKNFLINQVECVDNIFIKGNHDPNSLTNIQSMIIKFKGKTFELVHNPTNSTFCADYIIHGHIHKSGERRFASNVKQYNDYIWYDNHGNMFYNVNVEFHKYKPVLINNILGELEVAKEKIKEKKL